MRDGLTAVRIAAHAADAAVGLPDTRNWDDTLWQALYEFDWRRQFDLALNPKRVQTYYDQTLPADNYRDARFCLMCGVEFCSIHIDQNALDADGEVSAMDDGTVLAASPAAEVNLTPVGTHDTTHLPQEIEIGAVTFTPELHVDD